LLIFLVVICVCEALALLPRLPAIINAAAASMLISVPIPDPVFGTRDGEAVAVGTAVGSTVTVGDGKEAGKADSGKATVVVIKIKENTSVDIFFSFSLSFQFVISDSNIPAFRILQKTYSLREPIY
jgi:hypothetical protein